MSETPQNLAELKAVKDPAERARAAKAYIEERVEKARRDATEIRDEAIRLVLESNGPTATAKLCDVSVSTVKNVRGRK